MIAWLGSVQIWIVAIAIVTALNVLVRVVPIIGYARQLHAAARRPTPTATRWPPVVIFVPIRGGGEESRIVIEHLLALDYPNFKVQVMIDHPSDPAYQAINSLSEERHDPRLQIDFLRDRPPNRSLTCSAVLQFFEQLDPVCELISFCAGDLHLPRNYLKELAAPMLDPEIGSTLGNRWYQPQSNSWGSLVRYVWNAAAVVFMWVDQQPWAGSSILRPDDIRRSGILETWATGMVEDAPIKGAIRKIGLKLVFVPRLLVVSRDELTLRSCYEFIKRQFLWTRLYHSKWALVPISTLGQTLVMFLPWMLAILMAALGDYRSGLILAAIGAAFWCCEWIKLLILDRAARQIAAANGRPIPPSSFGLWFRILLAIPLAQFVSSLAVVASARLTRIRWSGIEYEIRGPDQIRRRGSRLQAPDSRL